MNYRKHIDSTPELAAWYDAKYTEMGDGWHTPAEECHAHLDALGVPYDKNLILMDVGCGAGHFLAEAEKRVTCLGCDVSQTGIEYASARCKASYLFCHSIEDTASLIPGKIDYVVSIGSLEHIVDLGKALDNIRGLLKPSGKFYFYCPNERWPHMDQPNERTLTDEEWVALFAKHGLKTTSSKRWGANQDNTAFIGTRDDAPMVRGFVIPANPKLNCGSGQRKFDTNLGWVNIDTNSKWAPDMVADWNDLSAFEDSTVDYVVSHHSLEHVGCGEGNGFVAEAYRVLKPGGSLLVFVPDMKKLNKMWDSGEINEQLYMTNVYGAYMGDEADRHKWGYSSDGLCRHLCTISPWRKVVPFDFRPIPGADIARDDRWICGMEAVK